MAISSLQTLGLCALVAYLLTKLIYDFTISPLRKFPGPLAARLTDVYRAYVVYQGNIDESNRQWHRKYGSAVRVGPNAVMLNNPDVIKTIYGTKNAWRKSNMYRPNDVMANGYRVPNLFNAQDQAWYDKYKRPVGGFYTLSKVLEMEYLVEETIDKFVKKLESEFLDDKDVSDTMMMDEWLAYYGWDSTMNMTFGRHYGFIEKGGDVDDLIKVSKQGLNWFAPTTQIPWIDNWLDKNPLVRVGPKTMVKALEFATRMTAEYKKGVGSHHHLLERYMKAKTTHPDVVDDMQVTNYTILSVGAGGDTTATSVRAVVYFLAKHPSSYAKLREEIDKAKLKIPVSFAVASKLPYLDAVIRESMRICPGIATMLEREVPNEGFELPDGRFIPAGTKVGINPGVTNRDSDVFGENVNEFIPERWLQGGGESGDAFAARVKRMGEVFDFTFGSGKRVCIGRNMARLEVWKVVATLYTLFDIKLEDPEHEWKYENCWFVFQRDMPMIISRRSQTSS